MTAPLAVAVVLVLALAPQSSALAVGVAEATTQLDAHSSRTDEIRLNTSTHGSSDSDTGTIANLRGPLQENEVEAALRKSLRALGGQISLKVLDLSKGLYPAGQLEFPLSGAIPPPLLRPACPFLWRGHRTSEGGNSFPIWARVQVTAKRQLVRIKVGLAAGQMLTANDLEAFDAIVCPLLIGEDSSPKDYEGLLLKRSLRSGSQLLPGMVKSPPAVQRGSIVPVEALIGRADIRFEAQADRSGYPGQVIELTNTASKRHFRGVVRTDGSVVVRALTMQRKAYLNTR
jgi:flagella basal body P-ring formation protein FlgA